jgi:hypothetical protein
LDESGLVGDTKGLAMLMVVCPVHAGTRFNLGQIRHEMICARRPTRDEKYPPDPAEKQRNLNA